MFGNLIKILVGFVTSFICGIFVKSHIDNSKENKSIKDIIQKYNNIDENNVDGEDLVNNGISAKNPENNK